MNKKNRGMKEGMKGMGSMVGGRDACMVPMPKIHPMKFNPDITKGGQGAGSKGGSTGKKGGSGY